MTLAAEGLLEVTLDSDVFRFRFDGTVLFCTLIQAYINAYLYSVNRYLARCF